MKNKRYKLILLGSIVSLCVLFVAIKVNNLLNSIQADWERTFIRNKYFFQEHGFSGKIANKVFFEKASRPYSLILELDTTTVNPVALCGYYDFYIYDFEEKTLQFVVSEEIYKNAYINDSVIKKVFSDSIYINDKSYLLFSKEQFKWLPQK